MSWKHVLIIVFALAAPLLCGLTPACQSSMQSIDTLSTVTIGGVLGHAGRTTRRKKKETPS